MYGAPNSTKPAYSGVLQAHACPHLGMLPDALACGASVRPRPDGQGTRRREAIRAGEVAGSSVHHCPGGRPGGRAVDKGGDAGGTAEGLSLVGSTPVRVGPVGVSCGATVPSRPAASNDAASDVGCPGTAAPSRQEAACCVPLRAQFLASSSTPRCAAPPSVPWALAVPAEDDQATTTATRSTGRRNDARAAAPGIIAPPRPHGPARARRDYAPLRRCATPAPCRATALSSGQDDCVSEGRCAGDVAAHPARGKCLPRCSGTALRSSGTRAFRAVRLAGDHPAIAARAGGPRHDAARHPTGTAFRRLGGILASTVTTSSMLICPPGEKPLRQTPPVQECSVDAAGTSRGRHLPRSRCCQACLFRRDAGHAVHHPA